MATDPRYERAVPAQRGSGRDGRTLEGLAVAEDHEGWVARSRVVLTPIAAPSIMGLFGFFIATLMLGAWQAGWYGPASATLLIWPFAIFAGGALQSVAAVASFRARDGVALAVHTSWGAFWLGWGILQLLVATHVMAPIAIGAYSPAFAFWFIALTLVTVMCFFGALRQNLLVALTLAFLSAGTALTAAGFYAASATVVNAGGWLFVCSATAAWLAATAMMLEHAWGRTILPLSKWSRESNIPGRHVSDPIGYPAGMPGVKVGQ